MKNKVTVVNLLHDQRNKQFRILINDKDVYSPFKYSDYDRETENRRLAKACAFDEICRLMVEEKKVLALHTIIN